jgi:hypothetical protein
MFDHDNVESEVDEERQVHENSVPDVEGDVEMFPVPETAHTG